MSQLNFIQPTSYTNVFNSFRADFDENLWDVDQEFNLLDSTNVDSTRQLNTTNNLKLRSTAKNSIVTYNAIQKVYKSRFDDSRSNVNFTNFTNSYTSYPFITLDKSPYEGSLGKKQGKLF